MLRQRCRAWSTAGNFAVRHLDMVTSIKPAFGTISPREESTKARLVTGRPGAQHGREKSTFSRLTMPHIALGRRSVAEVGQLIAAGAEAEAIKTKMPIVFTFTP